MFYILFKISVVRTKNLPLFSTNWKVSRMCYFKFHWISPLEIFPTIYSKLLKFSRIFSQNFHSWNLFKYCVKMLRMNKECTQNFLQTYQKFPNCAQNLSKRLEYLINFLCINFSKIFRTFQITLQKSLKLSSSYTRKTFVYVTTLFGWKFCKLYKNLSNISNKFS